MLFVINYHYSTPKLPFLTIRIPHPKTGNGHRKINTNFIFFVQSIKQITWTSEKAKLQKEVLLFVQNPFSFCHSVCHWVIWVPDPWWGNWTQEEHYSLNFLIWMDTSLQQIICIPNSKIWNINIQIQKQFKGYSTSHWWYRRGNLTNK